jgi:hypothetical protein
MNPTEIIRTTVDVIGVLLEVIRAIEDAVNNDDHEKVRDILRGTLLTSARRRYAETLAAIKFGPRES